MRVISQNAVGWPNDAASQAQILTWKMLPTILSPTQFLKIATYRGKTAVWQGSAWSDYFMLVVQHFPKLQEGTQVPFIITVNGTQTIGSARLISHEVNGNGNRMDPLGLFVTSTFQVFAPMHAGMIGPATASLSSGVEGRNVFFPGPIF